MLYTLNTSTLFTIPKVQLRALVLAATNVDDSSFYYNLLDAYEIPYDVIKVNASGLMCKQHIVVDSVIVRL